MNKWSALILSLIILEMLLSCSDEVIQSKPIISGDNIFDIRNCQCEPISGDSGDIPADCYEWGRFAWSGDDQNGDYHAIQGWLQAVTLDPLAIADSSGLIEIDYIGLLAVDRLDKSQSVVAVIDYGTERSEGLSMNEGGVFSRWYVDNSFGPLSNSEVSNGVLRVWPSLVPNRVCHWWLNSRGKYPRKSGKDYHLICRLRVSGKVAVQIAADYYKEINSAYPDNLEAWHSYWIGQTDGRFITVCYPQLN